MLKVTVRERPVKVFCVDRKCEQESDENRRRTWSEPVRRPSFWEERKKGGLCFNGEPAGKLS